MKRFWLAAAAALILTTMLPDGAFAQRGGFRGGGFGGGGFRGAAIGGGFRGAAIGGGFRGTGIGGGFRGTAIGGTAVGGGFRGVGVRTAAIGPGFRGGAKPWANGIASVPPVSGCSGQFEHARRGRTALAAVCWHRSRA